MSRFGILALSLALVCALSRPALAATVDGHLDPDYGPPLSLQTNDYPQSHDVPRGNFVDHTELDALHAYVSPDAVLHVFVTGNLRAWIAGSQPSSAYDFLFLYIDSQPGGQSVLRADNAEPYGLHAQAGLAFDDGFEPDWSLVAWVPDWCCGPTFTLHGYYSALTAGGSAGYELGSSDGGAPGALTGGTNPYDVRLAIDNSDASTGIGPGCGPGSGAELTTGVEWAIPLAALGQPVGCLRVMAYACYLNQFLENQVLPPVPAGSCYLGTPSGVNFAALAGQQFVQICPGAVPARRASWGSLKAFYR